MLRKRVAVFSEGSAMGPRTDRCQAEPSRLRVGPTGRRERGLAFCDHSYLTASTGSSRAARRAGYVPKKSPTTPDTSKAAAIAHADTCVGQPAYSVTATDAHAPSTTPSTPP